MLMKKCIIIGAMPVKSIKADGDCSVIAADAGLENAKRCGITPDIIIGDFDSLSFAPEGDNVLRFPVEKDDTDTMLAIKLGLKKGFKEFFIYGGIGGRLDHTIANIQSLAYIAQKGAIGHLIDDENVITVIKDSAISVKGDAGKNFAVFSLSDTTEGVFIKGTKYEAENITLTSSFPLGVSNSFKEDEATVSVKNGMLAIIREGEI